MDGATRVYADESADYVVVVVVALLPTCHSLLALWNSFLPMLMAVDWITFLVGRLNSNSPIGCCHDNWNLSGSFSILIEFILDICFSFSLNSVWNWFFYAAVRVVFDMQMGREEEEEEEPALPLFRHSPPSVSRAPTESISIAQCQEDLKESQSIKRLW